MLSMVYWQYGASWTGSIEKVAPPRLLRQRNRATGTRRLRKGKSSMTHRQYGAIGRKQWSRPQIGQRMPMAEGQSIFPSRKARS